VTASAKVSSGSTSAPEIVDWSSSYAQYLARSAAQSAKTLKLYQEALECVSQGRLAPTVFQDHLPQFMQAHAMRYSAKLTEVGARFLGGLLRLSASLPQPGAGSAAGLAADPEITAPHFDPVNPAGWFEQLAEYAGRLNARALKTYRAQLDRVAAGEITPSEVQEATSDYLSHRLPDYLQQIAGLYFELLNGLNDVRAEYEENYFRGVLGSAAQEDHEKPVVLALTGLIGSRASASLSVTNTTGERATVRHLVSDVRRADGVGPAFDPRVSIVPSTLELGPKEDGVLNLSLELDSEHYDPDALYVGVIYITGGANLRVEVQLRITATAATGL
jgi:hypothetical protein